MKYLQEFIVVGIGQFPFDMLRYDSCWPADQESAICLSCSDEDHPDFFKAREVRLMRYVSEKKEPPARARWASFGWRIKEKSLLTMNRSYGGLQDGR